MRRPPLAASALIAATLLLSPSARGGVPERVTKDPVSADLARFQGVWDLVSQVVNGEVSSQSKTQTWVLVVERDVYNPGSRETSIEYTIRIDPTRQPKAIDFTPSEGPLRGRTLRGIYRLEGSTLTICRALDPAAERPARFASEVDSEVVLIVWRRRGPAPSEEPPAVRPGAISGFSPSPPPR